MVISSSTQTTPRQDEGPSEAVLQATQDVCDHLSRMATRVSDLFDEFDIDKNGRIDKREFRSACLSLGITYPAAVLDQVFDLLDDDRSGQLEHNELVRKARRAAFDRGFMPRRVAKPPATQRRIDAYWARRNRMHMEAHEQSVVRETQKAEERWQQALEKRREEAISTLRTKHETSRQQGLDRQERFWLRRQHAEQRDQEVQRAVEATAKAPVRFLPALPEAARLAKATWAKDPCAPSRLAEREETIREISQLQDVWVGSIINAWKAPSAEEKAAAALKANAERARGKAPKSNLFKTLSNQNTPR